MRYLLWPGRSGSDDSSNRGVGEDALSKIPACIPNLLLATSRIPPTMCPEDAQAAQLQEALADNPLQVDVSIGLLWIKTCDLC